MWSHSWCGIDLDKEGKYFVAWIYGRRRILTTFLADNIINTIFQCANCRFHILLNFQRTNMCEIGIIITFVISQDAHIATQQCRRHGTRDMFSSLISSAKTQSSAQFKSRSIKLCGCFRTHKKIWRNSFIR